MSCPRCGAARTALANAARSAVSGNLKHAAGHLTTARHEIAAKAKDEADRVRALLRR